MTNLRMTRPGYRRGPLRVISLSVFVGGRIGFGVARSGDTRVI
ncbi:MAG TPA: hypothetical protein VM242_10720 [Acidimicrobiales bacterium]|jgi:hypothetical protein|nr:hypothetical protein [Acidimicrobiales bacterium]